MKFYDHVHKYVFDRYRIREITSLIPFWSDFSRNFLASKCIIFQKYIPYTSKLWATVYRSQKVNTANSNDGDIMLAKETLMLP